MIREIGTTMAGLLSALAVFVVVAFVPLSLSGTPSTYDWSILTTAPPRSPGVVEGLRYQLGANDIVYGVGPALMLILIALLAGVLVSRIVPRVAGSGKLG